MALTISLLWQSSMSFRSTEIYVLNYVNCISFLKCVNHIEKVWKFNSFTTVSTVPKWTISGFFPKVMFDTDIMRCMWETYYSWHNCVWWIVWHESSVKILSGQSCHFSKELITHRNQCILDTFPFIRYYIFVKSERHCVHLLSVLNVCTVCFILP